jgi:uncharacterized phiE125 gp8 family phage protein
MGLSLVTAPTSEPLTIAAAKLHLREDGDDQNGVIEGLITAARQHVEKYTRRALLPQTWDLVLDTFPCGAIMLPLAPVTAISSVAYYDTAGTLQTWSASLYRTHLPTGPWAMPGQLEPIYGESYPSTQNRSQAVTVRFVAGYANAAAVPGPILAGLKILVGHWYESREPIVTGTIVSPIPTSVDALLWPFKVF